MKKVILTIVVIILCFASANAEWDLNIARYCLGRTNLRLLSVPFEGLNSTIPNPNDSNRKFLIFNGPIHRRFVLYEIYNNSILFHSTENSYLRLASCFSEVVSTGKGVYGFGKYLIEFENYNNPAKNISFIFNTLDSKVGMDNLNNGRAYHSDWKMFYQETTGGAYVVIKNNDTTSNYNYIDTVFLGQSNREINYWYAYWRADAPLEKKFYARTTPFPMNPALVNDTNKLYNIKIGTKITFDTVYHNFGEQDRFGYNTVETNSPYDYYNNPPVPDFNYSQKGNIFTTPAHLYELSNEPWFTFGMKITTENSDTIILKKNKILYINGYDFHYGGDTLLLQQGSAVIKEEDAKLNACNGGIIIDEGCNSVWSANSMQRIYDFSKLVYNGTSHLINNGGKVEIDNLAELHIGNNTIVTFDGANTSLNLKPGAKVFFGQNAKIVFKNGAYLDANGATFSGINGATWQGIVFEQSNSQHIRYCTFNNALTSLKFLYDSRNEVIAPYIHDNTFNIVPSNSTFGIYSEDMNFATIGSNTFNMSGNYSVGIFMKTSAGIIPSSESDIYYKLLLYDNKFNGGFAGLYLASYASDLKPYFLYGNFFNVNSNNIGNFGIIGRKITGEIKNCVFSSTKTNCDMSVVQSSLRLTNNNLGAINNNISAYSNSTIGIAPNVVSNEIILTGGYNTFYSSSSDNFNLREHQNLYINNGYNCFSGHGSGQLHLMGYLNISGTTYDAYNNYWNTSAPNYLLFNNNQPPQPITLNWSQSAACKGFVLSVDQIIDRGNGVFDTIYKFQNSTNVAIQPDESMYNQAFSYLNNSNFPTAILNFKTLIDDYPTSMFLSGALYDLYTSYECLDTSSNQSFKDNLYSDLKTYLTAKINSNNYDAQFCDIAYNLILMCEANMQNYNDALTGYQFIAMYHPDAIARLMASWDYVEIEEFMNGMGGGDNENISEEKYVLDLTKRLEVSISRDSTMKNLKRQYVKEADQNNSKMKTDLGSKSMITKKTAIEKKTKDDMLIRKSVEVLMSSKSLTKEQKSKKQMEDIILITKNDKEGISNDSRNIIPNEYTLSQNYPNPFNPVTKINFELPMQGFVSLKIYDITGREIQTLVNEVKQAGYYSVDFNGSSLASGVYFYMIKTGEFVMTKRMVLIK